MKRSEINRILRETIAFFDMHRFKLPPFAFWTPADWEKRGEEADEIRDNLLGWDITDFGLGNFSRKGLVLFTLRNGTHDNPRYPKPYAEKIMVAGENQETPMHFHAFKMEDIINRGGGNLLIELYNATPDNDLDRTSPVAVSVDGVRYPGAGSHPAPDPGREHHAFPAPLPSLLWRRGPGPRSHRRGVARQR